MENQILYSSESSLFRNGFVPEPEKGPDMKKAGRLGVLFKNLGEYKIR